MSVIMRSFLRVAKHDIIKMSSISCSYGPGAILDHDESLTAVYSG